MPEPISPRDSEVLIQKYVSGQLTEEEAGRLLQHLQEERPLRAALLGQMETDFLLRELSDATVWSNRLVPPVTAAAQQEFYSKVVPLPIASRKTSWIPRSVAMRWVTGIAAAFTLIAGYWLWPDHDNLPRLVKAGVGVEMRRGRQRLSATGKLRLQDGDIIETGFGQSAVIEFSQEGTRLELEPETRLSLVDWEEGKHFVLHQGRVKATVASQLPGEPLVVATPEAEASVRGTEFSLSTEWNATWLKVAKGVVDLHDKSTGNFEPVKAGQYAVAAQSVELKARPIGQGGLMVPVRIEPRMLNSGGDGDWKVIGETVQQLKVSRFLDPKPGSPAGQNPFSWYSRQIPAGGNLEVSTEVRLDAAIEEPGPLGYAEFGFTLILDRKHLSYICVRDAVGKGTAKLHTFVLSTPPAIEVGESGTRLQTTLPILIGKTYQLKARLNHLNSDQVQFQAKIWLRGEKEPADWQLDAIRNAPLVQPMISLDTRRCACTFTNLQVLLME